MKTPILKCWNPNAFSNDNHCGQTVKAKWMKQVFHSVVGKKYFQTTPLIMSTFHMVFVEPTDKPKWLKKLIHIFPVICNFLKWHFIYLFTLIIYTFFHCQRVKCVDRIINMSMCVRDFRDLRDFCVENQNFEKTLPRITIPCFFLRVSVTFICKIVNLHRNLDIKSDLYLLFTDC